MTTFKPLFPKVARLMSRVTHLTVDESMFGGWEPPSGYFTESAEWSRSLANIKSLIFTSWPEISTKDRRNIKQFIAALPSVSFIEAPSFVKVEEIGDMFGECHSLEGLLVYGLPIYRFEDAADCIAALHKTKVGLDITIIRRSFTQLVIDQCEEPRGSELLQKLASCLTVPIKPSTVAELINRRMEEWTEFEAIFQLLLAKSNPLLPSMESVAPYLQTSFFWHCAVSAPIHIFQNAVARVGHPLVPKWDLAESAIRRSEFEPAHLQFVAEMDRPGDIFDWTFTQPQSKHSLFSFVENEGGLRWLLRSMSEESAIRVLHESVSEKGLAPICHLLRDYPDVILGHFTTVHVLDTFLRYERNLTDMVRMWIFVPDFASIKSVLSRCAASKVSPHLVADLLGFLACVDELFQFWSILIQEHVLLVDFSSSHSIRIGEALADALSTPNSDPQSTQNILFIISKYHASILGAFIGKSAIFLDDDTYFPALIRFVNEHPTTPAAPGETKSHVEVLADEIFHNILLPVFRALADVGGSASSLVVNDLRGQLLPVCLDLDFKSQKSVDIRGSNSALLGQRLQAFLANISVDAVDPDWNSQIFLPCIEFLTAATLNRIEDKTRMNLMDLIFLDRARSTLGLQTEEFVADLVRRGGRISRRTPDRTRDSIYDTMMIELYYDALRQL
jgi:hypothetical protein